MSLSAAQAANVQHREALIVCRLFPAACTTHLETRLNWATAAAGKLVAGVGWSQLVGLALCVAIGLRARRATASRPVRSRLAQYWLGGPRPANAFLAFKVFLAALLYLEWLGLTAPEQDILATPELMALVRKRPPWSYESYSSFQLYFTNIILARFLPCGTGGEFSFRAWVRFLARVRGMVVGCWACFLLWPHPALYAIGAIGYVYLGLIGLMYNPAHSTLAPMLFVLLATVAVGGLASGDAGAEAWLRRALLEVVLAPAYLFSGVSKMRYMGLAFFGGEWLRTELHDGPRVSLPGLVAWIRDAPGACEFLSFGNVLLEFILPCVLVVVARRDDINSRRFVHGFLFVALGFHVTIFLLMGIVSASSSLHRRRMQQPPRHRRDASALDAGPNFARMMLLLALAAWPTTPAENAPTPTVADARRGAVASVAVCGWFAAQLVSLVLHLTGVVAPTGKVDIRFPFSEMSMFARTETATYASHVWSALLVATLALGYAWHVRSAAPRGPDKASYKPVPRPAESPTPHEVTPEELATIRSAMRDLSQTQGVDEFARTLKSTKETVRLALRGQLPMDSKNSLTVEAPPEKRPRVEAPRWSRGRVVVAVLAVLAAVGLDSNMLGSRGAFLNCAAFSSPRDRGQRLLREARHATRLGNSTFPTQRGRSKYCLGVVSAPGRKTLDTAVRALTPELRADVAAAVYDVSYPPSRAGPGVRVYGLYNILRRRNKFYGGALPCPARRNASTIKAKSTADYASTLFSMPLDSCDVAVVLEDDVLPTRRLFDKLDRAVEAAEDKGPWAYLKLFVPDKYTGFEEYHAAPIASGGLALGLATAFASRSIILGAGVGALAVAFVVDVTRPCWVRLYNVMRPAPRLVGVPVAACSQAHVFPAAWATRLADYLCRHTDVPKDIATHRLARADGLGVHLVQPLLFQHVGTYSVILHHEKNPANVVSAGFSLD